MSNDKAIEKISELTKKSLDSVFTEDGIFYTFEKTYPVQHEQPDSLKLSSLTSLAVFVNSYIDNKYFIQVESPTLVSVKSVELDKFNRRDEVAYVDISDQVCSFRFGERLRQEEFIVGLQANFILDDNLHRVLDVASKVKVEQSADFEDNGITQNVSARQGVHLSNMIQVPSPIELKPFLTFPEIGPIEQKYIFRVHRKHERPEFALYSSESRNWEMLAMERVKTWLNDQVTIIVL